MIYDLKNDFKLQLAKERFNDLVEKQVVIELTEKKGKRNLDENGLYWVWLSCIQRETGRQKDECHLLYRCMFLRKDEHNILDYLKEPVWKRAERLINDFRYFPELNIIADIISRSTTDLDESYEFPAYLKQIRNHARVYLNVILLTKDDQNFEAFYREYGFH
jgi:hypothetical protein